MTVISGSRSMRHAVYRTVTVSLLECRGGIKIISRVHSPLVTRSSV
jgi:hypothetical protein